MRVRRVEEIRPPTTTMARGLCTSDPVHHGDFTMMMQRFMGHCVAQAQNQ